MKNTERDRRRQTDRQASRIERWTKTGKQPRKLRRETKSQIDKKKEKTLLISI